MSLINDALKRASGPTKPPTVEEAPSQLRPVEYQRRLSPWVILGPGLMLATIMVGGWLMYQGWQAGQGGIVAAARPAPVIQPEVSTPHLPTPAAVPEPPMPAKPEPTAIDTIVLPVTTDPPPAVTSVVPEPARPPAFKLQGVYYRPSKPSALVNGVTVYAGDTLENARVVAIDKTSVTLDVAGEKQVLTMRRETH